MDARESLRNVVMGALVGIFMILPGASGATMAVVLRIYERIIRDVSSLLCYIREDFAFLITLGIGGVAGVLLCAKGLDFLIEDHAIPLMFFFAALIVVQIPDMARQAEVGRDMTVWNVLALILGFAVMLAVLLLGRYSTIEVGMTSIVVMFLAGMIYAVCAISPGISGSTLLLALGLFAPVIEGLSRLDLMTLLPLALGAVVGVILFAKLMNRFITNNRKSTYMAILGLTAGSVVTVLVEAYWGLDTDVSLLECTGAIVLGLTFGYMLHMFSAKSQND